MIKNIPIFVSNEICLACEGCCRVRHPKSPWRPKAAKEKLKESISRDDVDELGYIKVKSFQEQYSCMFLNLTNNKCKIYAQRPFECQLYPFLLTKNNKGEISVSVHLSCPYILDVDGTDFFDKYVLNLKQYFTNQEVCDFIKNNKFLAGSYFGYELEIRELFKVKL